MSKNNKKYHKTVTVIWGGVRGGDYPCNQPAVKDRFFRLPENHIYEILVSWNSVNHGSRTCGSVFLPLPELVSSWVRGHGGWGARVVRKCCSSWSPTLTWTDFYWYNVARHSILKNRDWNRTGTVPTLQNEQFKFFQLFHRKFAFGHH